MNIAFYTLAFFAVVGALGAIRLRNLIYAVMSLMVFFGSLAGLFILLVAEFIAAAQILVYVGAVGILLLFAVMLTHHIEGSGLRIDAKGWWLGLLGALVLLFAFVLPSIRDSILLQAPTPVTASAQKLGQQLMSPYVITLQIMGLLLTVALIGAVAIAMGAKKGAKP